MNNLHLMAFARLKPLFVALLLPLHLAVYGQNPAIQNPEYKRLVETALVHLQKNECRPCLEQYTAAFVISKHSALSHLRAAACAFLCSDSASCDALTAKAASIDWGVCETIMNSKNNYPELNIVRGSRFEVKTRAEIHHFAQAAGINFALKKELETIHHDDQRYRLAMDSMRSLHRLESPEYKAYQHAWIHADSINVVKIEAIFAKYGYPGKSLVGSREASTGYLVVQHAPLQIQEKYLPIISEAAEKGECPKSNWAYLVDRINMHKKQPQLYGSQVVRDPKTGAWVFHPIEDEINVNIRRAEVGLGPLEEYAQMMGVNWALPTKK